jgi:hypothetical protein
MTLKELDAILDRIGSFLMWVVLLASIMYFTGAYKLMVGQMMFYKDYYDGKVKTEQSK